MVLSGIQNSWKSISQRPKDSRDLLDLKGNNKEESVYKLADHLAQKWGYSQFEALSYSEKIITKSRRGHHENSK